MNPQTFDPDKLGPRSRPAYQLLMSDGWVWSGQWLPWRDVVALMLRVCDLEPASCTNILKGMVAKGICEARGTWKRGADTRQLRFVEDVEANKAAEYANYLALQARRKDSEETS